MWPASAASPHHKRYQRDALRETQLQFHPRHCGGRLHHARARRHGGKSLAAGQDGSRVHRLCQGQSGQNQHGVGGRRRPRPHVRRTVQDDDGRQYATCALSRPVARTEVSGRHRWCSMRYFGGDCGARIRVRLFVGAGIAPCDRGRHFNAEASHAPHNMKPQPREGGAGAGFDQRSMLRTQNLAEHAATRLSSQADLSPLLTPGVKLPAAARAEAPRSSRVAPGGAPQGRGRRWLRPDVPRAARQLIGPPR